MRSLLLACLIATIGCSTGIRETPVVNPPLGVREKNYRVDGRKDNYSCMHAAWVTLLRWQGQFAAAEYWRANYSGGISPMLMEAALDYEGVRYTTGYDVEFLEWACKTRRGCVVIVTVDDYSRLDINASLRDDLHAVVLADLTATHAVLIDSNKPKQNILVPRDEFLANWRRAFGYAITPVYSPVPPLTE